MKYLFAGLLCLLPFAALSQDAPRSILVLDASGSMWGQIDGVTKIEIARDVISDLLETLPAEQELGLTVYGHRRRGDCTDIETVIEPGANQREAIAAAVNSINPRGKTPLSAAVIAAAEALRYTEERATVILVSDGRETCEVDPCEVGRALEEAGIDFTAHVIGFDVTDPADRAQLQCLAEETGGTFRTASNAAELGEALSIISEPEPITPRVTLRAVIEGNNATILSNLLWTLEGGDSVEFQDLAEANPERDLAQGHYRASVLRTTDGAQSVLEFDLTDADQIVTLTLPPMPQDVTFDANEVDASGPRITSDLVWSLYSEDGNVLVDNDLTPGFETQLLPGIYRVEVLRPADEATDEERFEVGGAPRHIHLYLPELLAPATLEAPESAPAGSLVAVTWSGPNEANDYVSSADIGSNGNQYHHYEYTRDGNTLMVRLPPEVGTYVLRYIQSNGRRILASREIEVTPVNIALDAPDAVTAGADSLVRWIGPDYRNDYISVSEIGTNGNQYINYTYTREGSPLNLQMPTESGEYELRYIFGISRLIAARQIIVVSELTSSVSAQQSASVGETIMVEWVGGDYQNDFISVAEVGSAGNQYENYSYTRDGNPLALQMPSEPGDYEIRYVLSQDREIVARTPIQVTPVAAMLSAEDNAIAGSDLIVTWDGPDYQNDYISVAEIGAAGNQYEAYTYTRDGSPLALEMPFEPGDYEIRYVLSQDREIIARTAIHVTPVTATLSAEDNAVAGSDLIVTWNGPDYHNDFISIAEAGDNGNQYVNYTYTRDGSPLTLQMPPVPGDYEIRYVAGASGRPVLISRQITVKDVTASLTVAATAAPGSNLVVEWEGPDYHNDYITISRVGDDGYEVYEYTRNGSPQIIEVPDLPGDYEVRYVMNQDRTIIARRALTVQ